MPDPRTLAELAADIARETGGLLLDALHGERTIATKSSETDMVTEMDRRAEDHIVERIRAARPDDGVIGEEGADHTGSSGVAWVIDPLDGTTNYLYRYPGWNVSVGVEIDGRPVAGAVAIPTTDELFVAAAGHGATVNGRPLRLGSAPPLRTALLGTGFNYDPTVRRQQAQVLVGLIDHVRDIRRMGAAAADLCSVAAGRLDGYYEIGLNRWDHCAGSVIAREAGATVELLSVTDLPGPLVVASHPGLFDPLCDLLVEAGLLDGR